MLYRERGLLPTEAQKQDNSQETEKKVGESFE